MDLPSADWMTQVITLGPPGFLLLMLASLIPATVLKKIELKQTLVLSGIAAVFFGLWMVALPMLTKRHVYVVTTHEPSALQDDYSLRPVRYKFGKLADGDLSDSDFDFPDGRDPVKLEFDLRALVSSYETNLRTVIDVAQNDPACFRQATQGVSYSRVAASIRKLCPGSLITAGRYD